MLRIRLASILSAGLTLAVGISGLGRIAFGAENAAASPNVLFIFADDHAYQAISAYGSKLIETPNIDRLAKEGVRFAECYVTNSICGPMRSVILSGKYSHINGFVRNGNQFDGTQWTFPKALQKVGYQTAIIGKWHLGEHMAPQGFNYSEVLIGQGPYYNPPMLLDENGDGKQQRVQHMGYTTNIITDRALRWLKEGRDKSKPFLLMYQHKAPHREWSPGPEHLDTFADPDFPLPETLFEDYSQQVTPRQTQTMSIAKNMSLGSDLKIDWAPRNLTDEQRARYLEAFREENEAFHKANLTGEALARWKYQRYMRIYLAAIKSVDDNVGRVLDYLDESGLADNTIVIYCSDQGFYLGEHGWFDKRWVYEESLRTPLLVRWPNTVKAGTVNDDIVSPVDFAATFCELAGAEVPGDLQGRSLIPVLHGETPADWRKDFYYHYYEYPGAHSVRRHYAVVDGRFKLIHFYEDDVDEWELIDLKADPLEQHNFYDDPKYQEVQARLLKRLGELRKELKVPDEDPANSYPGRRRGQRQNPKKTALKEVLHLDRAERLTRDDMDPSGKSISVGAWCKPTRDNGVIVAQGGGQYGYALYLQKGVPTFTVRDQGAEDTVRGSEAVELNKPVYLAGMLDQEGKLRIYVNGRMAARGAGRAITRKPADVFSVAHDAGARNSGSYVGPYESELPFQGEIRDLRVYWGQLPEETLDTWALAKPSDW